MIFYIIVYEFMAQFFCKEDSAMELLSIFKF